ncbi:hypothetical protein U5801_06535 [Lamprobacter modestohalophilus]|uniref:Ig-like domain-containing protein n=1 Tax=Lamprobacter modestohalophilus TaxID=1064514 RepID=UPI002ADED765|nr:hypothetical protein [Lamprobacter modestohalophilus]MEA1049460.1 hypothetical protein [Lamprobacter modestohalophilus]
MPYRCENEYGADPCEIAKNGTVLADTDVSSSMDGGPPKCPGKTESGKTCGEPLVAIGKKTSKGGRRGEVGGTGDGFPWQFVAISAAVVVGLIALACLFLCTGGKPEIVIETDPVTFEGNQSGPATGELRIKNAGDEELVVTSITATPAAFAAMRQETTLGPGKVRSILIELQSGNDARQGEVVLETNDPKADRVAIKLDASRVPREEASSAPEPSQDPWEIIDEINRSAEHLE